MSAYLEIKNYIKESKKDITLLAVSKGQTIEKIIELHKLGQLDFAENYSQELIEKQKILNQTYPEIRWHFIGPVQSNKVKSLAPLLSSCHSITRLKTATLFSELRVFLKLKPLECFVQVNIDNENSKEGVASEEAKAFCKTLSTLPGLNLQGLMCIPKQDNSEDAFKRLAELEITCRPFTQGKLSMGMSNDYQLAIAAGATHIRVGTLLFGKRLS